MLWRVNKHGREKTGIAYRYIQYWLGGGLKRNQTGLTQIDLFGIGEIFRRLLRIGGFF